MKSTYIIGEIGQNHNGSVDIAKLIVDLVSRPVREEVFNLELRQLFYKVSAGSALSRCRQGG